MEQRRLDRLIEICEIQSKSKHESQKDMEDFVKQKIEEYGGTVVTDDYGNVYGIKGDADTYPCMVSHIDTVHTTIPDEARKVMPPLNGKLYAMDLRDVSRTGIGGDDKVGVFITLELFKLKPVMKAAFFKDEEVGCVGSGKADKEFFNDVEFVLQCDRKKIEDFVYKISGTKLYGDEFSEAIKPILDEYSRSEVIGGLTDVHALASDHDIEVCMANMSCGYYEPHSKDEYIELSEADDTLEMCIKLFDRLTGKVWEIERPKYSTGRSYGGYNYGGGYYGGSYVGGSYNNKNSKTKKSSFSSAQDAEFIIHSDGNATLIFSTVTENSDDDDADYYVGSKKK